MPCLRIALQRVYEKPWALQKLKQEKQEIAWSKTENCLTFYIVIPKCNCFCQICLQELNISEYKSIDIFFRKNVFPGIITRVTMV